MRKKISSLPPLRTVVVQNGEYFYVLQKTQGGIMWMFLGECDNGKGGKASFLGTDRLPVRDRADIDYICRKYISMVTRSKLWGNYTPKRFNSFEEAKKYLWEKKNIRLTDASLYTPSN